MTWGMKGRGGSEGGGLRKRVADGRTRPRAARPLRTAVSRWPAASLHFLRIVHVTPHQQLICLPTHLPVAAPLPPPTAPRSQTKYAFRRLEHTHTKYYKSLDTAPSLSTYLLVSQLTRLPFFNYLLYNIVFFI